MADISETGKGRLAYSVLNWVDEAHNLFAGLREDFPKADFPPRPDIDAFYERFLLPMKRDRITEAMEAYAQVGRDLEDYCARLMLSQLR